jgi:hypothetical protein
MDVGGMDRTLHSPVGLHGDSLGHPGYLTKVAGPEPLYRLGQQQPAL